MIKPKRFRVIGRSNDLHRIYYEMEFEWGDGDIEVMYSSLYLTIHGDDRYGIPSELQEFKPVIDIEGIGPWCKYIELDPPLPQIYQKP